MSHAYPKDPNSLINLMSIDEIMNDVSLQAGSTGISGMTRRDFLRTAGVGAAGVGLALSMPAGFGHGGGAFAAGTGKTSVVVRVQSDKVISASQKINGDIVQRMVDGAVLRVAEKKDIKTAWSEFISAKDVVGIKINGIAGQGLSSNVETVNAIIKRLLEIGVAENSIVVWGSADGRVRQCGFRKNTGSTGVRYMDVPDMGYDVTVQMPSIKTRIAKILTQEITALINVPVLKDHGLAGVTLSLKNISHGVTSNPGDMHSNNGDPYIAEVNDLPVVKKKHRIVILDGIRACYNGGPGQKPQWVWEDRSIMAAVDPVAIDVVGARLIDKKRVEMGMPLLSKSGRPWKHIHTAARKGLGTDDVNSIKVVKLNVG